MYNISFSIQILRKELNRKVIYSLGIEGIPNSSYLRNCNQSYTDEIIQHLEKILSGDLNEYEWGQERIYITSNKYNSQIEDMIHDECLGTYSTSVLLEVMRKWKLFLQKWNDINYMNEKLKIAFQDIILSPMTYHVSENFYKIQTDTNVSFNLILSDSDLLLTPEEYCLTVKTKRII